MFRVFIALMTCTVGAYSVGTIGKKTEKNRKKTVCSFDKPFEMYEMYWLGNRGGHRANHRKC